MDNDWTKVLGFPDYRVYQHGLDESRKRLTVWIRGKPGNQVVTCSGCGRRASKIHEGDEGEVRDLPSFEFQTAVEPYRVGRYEPRSEGGESSAATQQVLEVKR